MSFLGELKRRNVFKVATAYAIVAWLIIQVATAVFPPMRFPEWSVPLVIVFLVLGFPIALIAAWAYELTPAGIKPARDVSPDESQVHVTGRKLNYAIIGLLALALAFVIVDAYVLDDSPPSAGHSDDLAAGGRSRVDAAAPAPRVSRVSINPSPGERWVISPHDPDFAISPDGTRIAYIARRGNANHVVLRQLDAFEGRSLGSFGGAVRYPFFSPDGQWVAFVDGNVLKKANVRDGTAATIAVLPHYMNGATWGSSDTIIVGTLANGLYRVPAAGGEPEPLATGDEGRASARWPHLLPDGNTLLYASVGAPESSVRVRSLDTGADEVLVRNATFPRVTSSGHLLYVSDNVLWAAVFDSAKLTLASTAVPIVAGVMIKGPRLAGLGAANVDVADDGTLVYRAVGTEGAGTSTLVWVDRNGIEEPLPPGPQVYGRLALAPDSKRFAIEITDVNLTNSDIWIGEVAAGTLRRLTFDTALNEYPVWSPDSSRVAFRSTRDGGGIFWQAADGTGGAGRLATAERVLASGFASPDGDGFVYNTPSGPSGGEFYLVPFAEGPPRRLDLLRGTVPALSPNGRWLAYSWDETGDFEIYVQPYPNPRGEKWRISSNGGRDPVWSRDGKELYFQSDTRTLAATVVTDGAFVSSPPTTLFEGPYIDSTGRWYGVGADGRFLMVKPGWLSAAQDTPLNVVLNWFEELRAATAD